VNGLLALDNSQSADSCFYPFHKKTVYVKIEEATSAVKSEKNIY